MRLVARLLIAVASAALPVALVLASCSTDAENVDACRQIEGLRCELAPQCSTDFDVDGCKRRYRDECLVGTANPDAATNDQIQGCLDALKACAAADAGCQGLVPEAKCLGADAGDITPTPCNIVMHCPEVLGACNWVVGTPGADGGADADAADDGSTDGGSDGSADAAHDGAADGGSADAADDGSADGSADAG